MCLKRDIEYYSSSESINFFNGIDVDWPLEQIQSCRKIVACNFCYYPLSFDEHVVDKIKNEYNNTFGLVIPMNKLFQKVVIKNDDPLEQWRSVVYCYVCCSILSFSDPNSNNTSEADFQKITQYKSTGEQIIILDAYNLFRGSSELAQAQSDF